MYETIDTLAKLGIFVAVGIFALPFVLKQEEPRVRALFLVLFLVAAVAATIFLVMTAHAAADWFRSHRQIAGMTASILLSIPGALIWSWCENHDFKKEINLYKSSTKDKGMKWSLA